MICGFYLTLFFATIALLVCIHLLTYNDNLILGKQLPSGIFSYNIPLLVGSFSSMLGIGGGTFNVSIMSLYGVPIHKAVGTSAGLGFFYLYQERYFLSLLVCLLLIYRLVHWVM